MKLRRLDINDLNNMYEWMNDLDIKQFFTFAKNDITKRQISKFIVNSKNDKKNIHLAIADENNEYLGTVSLKNIDLLNRNAEYAISLRKKAIGTGLSKKATDTILYIAFYELGLNRVYLNVLAKNIRAIRFYEKYGFKFEGEFCEHIYLDKDYLNLKWFAMSKKIFTEKNSSEFIEYIKYYEKYIINNINLEK